MDEKIKEMEKVINLGIMANGGAIHKKNWCQCDPSVGAVPCEYCAIFNALNKANDLLSRIQELEDAINNAQMENPSEVHCSCVPLLKARIKELEKGAMRLMDRNDKLESIIEGLDEEIELASDECEVGVCKCSEMLDKLIKKE